MEFRENIVYKVIFQQAELSPITWGAVVKGGTEEKRKELLKKLDKVMANVSKLEDWANRTRPEGEYLEVARSLYRQFMGEIKAIKSVLETIRIIEERKKERDRCA